jgi:FkbM family methyltransferase
MSFISYAQNFEDVMLWRALKHVQKGFYIDVGAAWPDEHSVTKAFYDLGWHGVNVEPNPVHYSSLVKQRERDINLEIAVGEDEGTLTINLVGETGLSTLDCAIADQYHNGGLSVIQQSVSVKTLASICLEHVPLGQEIHFLKVDVEGFEDQALRGHDWSNYRPWIVLVEATLPMTQQESYESWEPFLLKANYIFAYADGLNRYYVAKEHSALALKLKHPPNVFDGYLLIDQIQAEAKAQQAEAKAQQAEADSAKYAEQLQRTYASNSWRITAPLRWTLTQAKRLSAEGPKSRVKAFIKKVLRKVNHDLLLRPALRQRVLRWSGKLGLYTTLKSLQLKAIGHHQSTYSDAQDFANQPASLQNLPPRARQIYAELKAAIEQHHKGYH